MGNNRPTPSANMILVKSRAALRCHGKRVSSLIPKLRVDHRTPDGASIFTVAVFGGERVGIARLHHPLRWLADCDYYLARVAFHHRPYRFTVRQQAIGVNFRRTELRQYPRHALDQVIGHCLTQSRPPWSENHYESSHTPSAMSDADGARKEEGHRGIRNFHSAP